MRAGFRNTQEKLKSLTYLALPWDTENKLLLKFRADVEALYVVYSHVRSSADRRCTRKLSLHTSPINQPDWYENEKPSSEMQSSWDCILSFSSAKEDEWFCKSLSFPLLFLPPPLGLWGWRLSVYRFNLHWAFALFRWLFLQSGHSESDCWLLCLGISTEAPATRSTDPSYAPTNYCATSSMRPLKLQLLIPRFCMPDWDKAGKAAPKYPLSL